MKDFQEEAHKLNNTPILTEDFNVLTLQFTNHRTTIKLLEQLFLQEPNQIKKLISYLVGNPSGDSSPFESSLAKDLLSIVSDFLNFQAIKKLQLSRYMIDQLVILSNGMPKNSKASTLMLFDSMMELWTNSSFIECSSYSYHESKYLQKHSLGALNLLLINFS